MTTIEIGYPTKANMDAAMESAGFTVTDNNGTSIYSWTGGDANNGMVLEYRDGGSGNWYIDCKYKDAGELKQTVFVLGFGLTTIYKLNIESLARGGIIIGYSSTSDVVYEFAWVAPKTSGDGWFGISGIHNSYNWYFWDYGARKSIRLGSNSIYNDATKGCYSDDIQMVQVYNGIRFADNLYFTQLAPSLNGRKAIRATIGDNQYLIWNHSFSTGNYAACFALEMPTS